MEVFGLTTPFTLPDELMRVQLCRQPCHTTKPIAIWGLLQHPEIDADMPDRR